jgi:hypothetical protein
VSNYKIEHVLCHKPSGFCHFLYEPLREYMELHFLHVLEPLNFILTSSLGGEMKRIIILLSQLHCFYLISDRVNKFASREFLEWIWWKFSFT